MTILRSLAIAALASVSLMGAVQAQEKLQFAVVPKAMNNPFFDLTRDGCMAEAQALGIAVPSTWYTDSLDEAMAALSAG